MSGHRPQPPRARSLGRWLAVAFVVCACSRSEAEVDTSVSGPPDAVYRVRGRIVRVESAGEHVLAHVFHEAIPNFVDREGHVDPRPAMVMPFALSDAIDREALTPRSQWRMTLEVRWRGGPGLRVVEVEPLRPGTKLELPSGR